MYKALLSFIFITLFSFTSQAEEAVIQRPAPEPLLTVRFNQPAIRFTRQLRQAVHAAQQKKPQAHFTVIIDRMPGSNEKEAQHVAATFRQLIEEQGVAPSQITTSVAPSSPRPFNEANLYVN